MYLSIAYFDLFKILTTACQWRCFGTPASRSAMFRILQASQHKLAPQCDQGWCTWSKF